MNSFKFFLHYRLRPWVANFLRWSLFFLPGVLALVLFLNVTPWVIAIFAAIGVQFVAIFLMGLIIACVKAWRNNHPTSLPDQDL